jgi:glutathione S-transferase
MKLYYKPGACSLAAHIVLRESGAAFDLERVDTNAQKTESGADYAAVNRKGYVPALALDDGAVLTENPALLQFIADRYPDSGLAPKPGTMERVRLQEHLNFVSSELHKAFSPFFAATPPEGDSRATAEARLFRRLDDAEATLADGQPFLLGDAFTVADAYLFVIAGWANPLGIGLKRWPRLDAFVERVAAREPTRDALRAEGLLN